MSLIGCHLKNKVYNYEFYIFCEISGKSDKIKKYTKYIKQILNREKKLPFDATGNIAYRNSAGYSHHSFSGD